MKAKDLINQNEKAKGIGVAIIQEEGENNELVWNVYFINFRKEPLTNVIIKSKGYLNTETGESIKSSTLRRLFQEVPEETAIKVEPIMEDMFQLNNEFWVSFFSGNDLLDRKFVFTPGSVNPEFFREIPIINKEGVLIH